MQPPLRRVPVRRAALATLHPRPRDRTIADLSPRPADHADPDRPWRERSLHALARLMNSTAPWEQRRSRRTVVYPAGRPWRKGTHTSSGPAEPNRGQFEPRGLRALHDRSPSRAWRSSRSASSRWFIRPRASGALLGTRPSDPETLAALRERYHLNDPSSSSTPSG